MVCYVQAVSGGGSWHLLTVHGANKLNAINTCLEEIRAH